MAKRKSKPDDVDHDGDANMSGSDSDSQPTLIDVDFEFFDPDPQVDYHAFVRLLRQLLPPPALGPRGAEALADLILTQPGVGSTVKTDGKEADPYALMTVINTRVHREHTAIRTLLSYLAQHISSEPALHTLLTAPSDKDILGIVFCERLVNMPVQTVPPMYTMLLDELASATADGEPFAFTHFLILSRAYRLSASDEDALRARAPSKRAKKAPSSATSPPQGGGGVYPFHPEDVTIAKFASHTAEWPFAPDAAEREADAFGPDVRARMFLVPAHKFGEMVKGMREVYQ